MASIAAAAWAPHAVLFAGCREGEKEREEDRDVALRDELRSPEVLELSCERMILALRRAHAALDVEHHAATVAWGSPLSLHRREFEAKDPGRVGPEWAWRIVDMASNMVHEKAELDDLAEVYEAQVLTAHRDGRRIAKASLLALLERLDALAAKMRAHLPFLRAARTTLLGPPRGAPGDPERLEDYEQDAGKAIACWRELDWDADTLERVVILEPDTSKNNIERYWRSFCTAVYRNKDYALVTLESAICTAEAAGKAVGMFPRSPGEAAQPCCMAACLATAQMARRALVSLIGHDARSRAQKVALDLQRCCLDGLCKLPCINGSKLAPKLTTGYWDFRGLGAPMRMMCVYAGAESEDVKYEARQKSRGCGWVATEWERVDKPELQVQNPFAQLPYVINQATGDVVVCSNAVSLYLGRLLGLSGSTNRERIANEQVLFYAYQMFIEVFDLVYPFKGNSTEEAFREALDTHFRIVLPGHLEKLENWLILAGTLYFAGSRLCTADFYVWEVLDQHEAIAREHGLPPPLEDFELLEAHHCRIKMLPGLRAYFESDDARLPFNNKMAFFR